MQKMFPIVVIIAAIGIAGGGYYLYAQQNAGTSSPAMEDLVEGDAMAGDAMMAGDKMGGEAMDTTGASGQVAEAGSYTMYSPEAAVQAAENGTALLFFHAAWCPTCKAADADITSKLSQIPAGLTILKTDYDTYTDLKKKYGVTYQHTFVEVDAQGNLIQKWNGGSLAEIIKRTQ